MVEAHLYLLVVTAYALLGVGLCVAYYFSARLREEPFFHVFTVSVIFLAGLVAALGVAATGEVGAFHRLGQFLIFVAATLSHLPVIVYLVLHYWELLLERITSPGSRAGPPRAPQTAREQWEQVRHHLETLSVEPTNVQAHDRLGDLYTKLGFLDAAVYQYLKAAEWIDRGYAHGHVLYKAARVIVEKRGDIQAALGLLRRIVRIYPRSYFSAYARRIINHHEAHARQDRGKSPAESQ